MKQQIIHRLGRPHIRNVLRLFNDGVITADEAQEELGIGRSRLFTIRRQYLHALLRGNAETWEPGASGGDRHPAWPEEAVRFLRRVLAPPSPYSYAFAASEMERTTASMPTGRRCASGPSVTTSHIRPRPAGLPVIAGGGRDPPSGNSGSSTRRLSPGSGREARNIR